MSKVVSPSEPGFYFARASNYQWWNYIVLVEGESPYLHMSRWAIGTGCIERETEFNDITEWGPKIVEPTIKSWAKDK